MSHISRQTQTTLLLADGSASLLALGLSAFFISIMHHPADVDQIFQAGSGLFSLSVPFLLASMAYFAAKGHYTLKTPWWPQVVHILTACTASFTLSALVIYAWQVPADVAQDALLWFFMPLCLVFIRWIARNALIRKGLWAIPTVLAGHYEALFKLAQALKAETYLTYGVQRVFILDADDIKIENFKKLYPQAHIHPEINSFSFRNSHVFFCPRDRAAAHDEILAELEKNNTHLAYVPPMEDHFLYGAELQRFFGHGVIALAPRRYAPSALSVFSKDILDKIVAAIALVLLSPVFLIISRAIRKDGGPAIYGHRRIGRNGRPFTCLKFRSMVVNSREILNELLANNPDLRKEYEETYKLKNDPRITKIGKFLRKTSLDELPQLMNVLRGEMSLTGPRPIVEDEKKYYAERIHDYLSVKPGITGLWQVSGRNDTDYGQRVYLDSWYVRNWSLWNDMIILFKTILVVLKRKGAY